METILYKHNREKTIQESWRKYYASTVERKLHTKGGEQTTQELTRWSVRSQTLLQRRAWTHTSWCETICICKPLYTIWSVCRGECRPRTAGRLREQHTLKILSSMSVSMQTSPQNQHHVCADNRRRELGGVKALLKGMAVRIRGVLAKWNAGF